MKFEWKEELPDNCPPNDAFSPEGKELYRLIESNTAKESDFFII